MTYNLTYRAYCPRCRVKTKIIVGFCSCCGKSVPLPNKR